MTIQRHWVLLVDDNPADIDLISEVLKTNPHAPRVSAVRDGEEAMAFLQQHGKLQTRVLPDLMMLDLNLPRKDGRTVLAEVRLDSALKTLPVVIFTTSQARHDIVRSYELGANCYVSKPGSLQDFVAAVGGIADFWLGSVRLPGEEKQ